jgi:hypothetical protein
VTLDDVYRSWLRGHQLGFTKQVLGHAVEQGWLTRDGDTFKPGEPVPVPVRDEEPLSRRERRTRWGTGPGSDW